MQDQSSQAHRVGQRPILDDQAVVVVDERIIKGIGVDESCEGHWRGPQPPVGFLRDSHLSWYIFGI